MSDAPSMKKGDAKYTVEVDGTRIRLGALDVFQGREMPTVVRRILRDRPAGIVVIRPVQS